VAQVAGRKFDLTTPELRDNILDFYSHLTLPLRLRRNPGERQNVLTGLHELKSMIPVVSGRQISARSRFLPTAQKTEERTVESKEWRSKDLMEA
jgi:hypothetical protein